jgi:ABC-type multidrug transport system fused ATPase/permease subunit
LALASLYDFFVTLRQITKKFIVSGTLRSNLDPFGLHDDARLWDALRRSYLVDTQKRRSVVPGDDEVRDDIDDKNGNQTSVNRFTLDSVIEDEGNNLSMGQVSRFTFGEWQVSTVF